MNLSEPEARGPKDMSMSATGVVHRRPRRPLWM